MNRVVPPLLLIFTGLLSLSPLFRPSADSVIHSIIHWDSFGYHYPSFVFITDALKAPGGFPWWNAFAALGQPFFCDPQTMLWWPPTLLIAMTVGWGLLGVQALLIAYFLWAGLGTYFLLRRLRLSWQISWVGGFSFMFCGYFVGHASHLGTFATIAWLPWIIAAGLTGIRAPDFRCRAAWGCLAGFCLGQATVGGHPTTAFLSGLNLAALLLIWPLPFRSLRASWAARFTVLTGAGIVSLAIAAPQIFGALYAASVFPYFDESKAVLEQATHLNDLLPRNAATFALPGLAVADWRGTYLANDPMMAPCYIGLLALIGAGAALGATFRGRVARISILAAANLLLAFGATFSARLLSYFWIPGLKLPHRAAMDFRGFALLLLIILGALGISRTLAAVRARRSALPAQLSRFAGKLALFAVAGGFLCLGATLVIGPDITEVALPPGEGVYRDNDASLAFIGDELLIFGVLAAAIAWMLYAAGRIRTTAARMKFIYISIMCIVFIDMSSALWRMWPIVADGTNAELWTTVLGREGSRPREFAPDQWETLERDAAPAWAAISHVPTTESFNPLALVDTKSPEDLAEVAKLWEEFGESRGRLVPRDAAGVDESARTAMLQELSPSGMIWAVEAAPGTTLQVLASWSPGWHASIDGGDWTPVRRVEKSRHLMEVPLPPGAREIRLEFSVPGLWRAVAFSLFGYLLSILSILLISRSRKRNTIP